MLSEANLDPSGPGSASYEIASFSAEDFMNYGFEQLIAGCRELSNDMWAATLANWAPTAAYKLSKNAVTGGDPSWREILYELAIPTSYIFGEYSLPDKDYEELAAAGIHVEVVENAGHSMAWENPAGLAATIANCISSR